MSYRAQWTRYRGRKVWLVMVEGYAWIVSDMSALWTELLKRNP